MQTYEQLRLSDKASALQESSGFRTSLILALVIGVSLFLSELTPSRVFSLEGIRAAGEFLTGLFPPDFSPSFLALVGGAALETVAIGIAGITLAIVFGSVFGPLSSHSVMGSNLAPRLSRVLLSFIRSIPDLIWAVFFVRLVGLGPFAGVLAIGISYGGILGKMYGELIDAAAHLPVEALRGAGAGRTGQLVFALLPQAWSDLVGYSMYRWECAVRSATLLGIVGAGGLGLQIDLSMRLFRYGEVSTMVLAMILIVLGIDRVSASLKRIS